MADPKPVLRGENVPVKIFVNNVPQPNSDLVKSIDVTEAAVMHRDQYLGQDRAKTDKQVDGYDVEIEMDMATTTLLDALLAQEAARAANQPAQEITIMVTLQKRDGTSGAYYVNKLQAKYSLGAQSRTDAVSQKMSLQGERLTKVA